MEYNKAQCSEKTFNNNNIIIMVDFSFLLCEIG